MSQVNINFLAIDFDKTIMEIYTGACSNWKQSAQELLLHIRPMFRRFLPLAIKEGIHVAVVTFSSKTELVHYILDHITDRALPKFQSDVAFHVVAHSCMKDC